VAADSNSENAPGTPIVRHLDCVCDGSEMLALGLWRRAAACEFKHGNLQGLIMASTVRRITIRSQPLIAVRDVRASSRWYQQLLGFDSLPEHSHRDVYDRMHSEGQLVLQLHAWDAEDHPNLVNADAAPVGHGVVLWFEVDDFDAVVEQARALGAEIIEEPHVNPAPGHREMWLRDPDGYVVVVASPDGESGA
jgi:catechol 2,3-dioxygenase-like lactoylglutathione lyase family enzyme